MHYATFAACALIVLGIAIIVWAAKAERYNHSEAYDVFGPLALGAVLIVVGLIVAAIVAVLFLVRA